jgi:hypothetical protein
VRSPRRAQNSATVFATVETFMPSRRHVVSALGPSILGLRRGGIVERAIGLPQFLLMSGVRGRCDGSSDYCASHGPVPSDPWREANRR